MNLHEAKASLERYDRALAASESMFNDDLPAVPLREAMLALRRRTIARIDTLARESFELAASIAKGIAAAPPGYLETHANEVWEVNAALHRLKLTTDKANETKERFKTRDSMGEFTIDIQQAKAFRDFQLRSDVLLRKRYGPTENGHLTASEVVEAAELEVTIAKVVSTFVCPLGYGAGDARLDSDRINQLYSKRITPFAELSNEEDEEDARLRVRVAAYRRTPEGRDRARLHALTLKRFGIRFSDEEQKELDSLKLRYSTGENPKRQEP